MAARPSVPLPPPGPAEMEQMVARAGLRLNPGQMADLVLIWRQLSGLIAGIPRDRPMVDDSASVFRLPPPAALAPQARPGQARAEPDPETCRARAMKGTVPPFPTIAEAARLIASKKLSPVELTRALLQRIAAVDPKINAFLTVTEETGAERGPHRRTRRAGRAEEPAGSASRSPTRTISRPPESARPRIRSCSPITCRNKTPRPCGGWPKAGSGRARKARH